MSFNCLFSWLCLSHKTCTLTLLDIFSWFCEYYMCYIDFECHWLSDFHVSWNIFLFYSFLEGFRARLQFYHIITSCVFFILVEFSIVLKLFSNLFLKTRTHHGRLVGRPCLVCIIENLFELVLEMGGREYELYTCPHCIFNWYHNWYLFCILIFISIYVCFNFK